jgi:DNA-binding MarR family transcriptional regulator
MLCIIATPAPAYKPPIRKFRPRPKHTDSGWAKLPHSIVADARLTAVDVRVLAALLYWARTKDWCTPCDGSIAARAGGISPGTVQRSLRRLASLGLIRRDQVPPSDQNRTGRVLRLLWRTSARTPDHRRVAPGRRRQTPRSPARDEEFNEMKNQRNVTVNPSMPAILSPDPPALPAPDPMPMTPLAAPAVQGDQPLQPLPEALKAIPGASPAAVRQTGWRIAHVLDDASSIGFYIGVLAQVVAGTVSVEAVLAAFKTASEARGNVRSRGALFTWYLRNYQPAPKPSQINRPQYHRAAASLVSEPAMEVMSREEEVEQCRMWLATPRSPFARYAKHRLAQLEASPPPSG